jgi:hypothetical protein
LCRRHHRAVHEGGFTLVQRDGTPVFYRPDGTRVEIVPAAHRLDDDADLRGAAVARAMVPGVAIGPYTAAPRDGYAAIDVAWAIDILRCSIVANPVAPLD